MLTRNRTEVCAVPVAEITPQELKDVLTQEPHPPLIDVRPPVEFRRVHLLGAENIPFDEAEVRELAQYWQLPVWDKPAMPCLSSRIAYGQEVTPE